MFYYNDYPFEENKNYLIYYRGAFNPVSKGHFSLLEKYIHYPNVRYLISQIGDTSRHGVPYELSLKIWNIYIRELLPEYRDKITIVKTETSKEILSYIQDINTVLFIRGREFDLEDKEEKEKEYLNQYRSLKRKLRRHNIKLNFLFIDRPEKNILSSSKFIQALLNNSSREKLSFFLPPLPESEINYILNKLKKQKLKL
jgi:hypothetical protein